MIRNLKALGLALLAVFAMGALAASSASATDVFTTDGPTWLTGTSHDNVFNITGAGSSFECTTSSFKATVTNGASSATATPTYTGQIGETPHGTTCSATIGTVTIDMNGCNYILSGETTGSDNGTDATVSIECPGTNRIAITGAFGTTVTVPAQTPTSGGVTYTNLPNHTGGASVRVTATVTGITYNCDGAFGCGLSGIPSHGNDADYTGTVDVTGYAENEDGTESTTRTAVSAS